MNIALVTPFPSASKVKLVNCWVPPTQDLAGPWTGAVLQQSTMAEEMDVDEEEADKPSSRPWDELRPDHPRTFVEVHNRDDAFLTSGEFFCLDHPVPIRYGNTTAQDEVVVVKSTVGRIILVEYTNPPMVLANFLVLASEFPDFPLPHPATPLNTRTDLEYLTELIWTDTVQHIPASQVKSEDCVFCEIAIKSGYGGICTAGWPMVFLSNIAYALPSTDGKKSLPT